VTLTIGIDIGGTKVAGGVVDGSGVVLASTLRSTPASAPAAIRDVVADVVTELRAKHEVTAVGIGAAGWIDSDRSTVQFAPNLAWRDEPLRDALTERLDLPVVVENDANVAAWAEFQFGAAREAASAILFTVGTGIGGGIIWNGHLVRGSHGVAAEFGHGLAVPGGRECGCGRHGCLEQYASGNALVRYARETAAADPDAAEFMLKATGGVVEAIDGPLVTQAAEAGEPAAVAAFVEIGGYLGEAMADMAQFLDPDVIIVGGGVIKAGELLLAPTRERFTAALGARAQLPTAVITAAQMGRQAGIIGAADLARH